MHPRRFHALASLPLLLLTFFVTASAQAQGGPPSGVGPQQQQLTISRVDIEYSATTPPVVNVLHIYGTNFGAGTPAVTLDGTPLNVLFSDDGRVDASTTAARAFTAGNYLLKVSAGVATAQTGVFDLTVGAQGPKGDTGPQGPKGDTGPAGSGGGAVLHNSTLTGDGTAAAPLSVAAPLALSPIGGNAGPILAGDNLGTGVGVRGLSSSSAGVRGFGNGGAGTFSPGVHGISTFSPGVLGENRATAATPNTNLAGVTGSSTYGPGVQANSVNGNGVQAATVEGFGVTGFSQKTAGLVGGTDAPVGGSAAIFGSSNNTPGVMGFNNASAPTPGAHLAGVNGHSNYGPGVHGVSENDSGVLGFSNTAVGVKGQSGSGVGVYGVSGTGPAGKFDGKVIVNGPIIIGNAGQGVLLKSPSGATCGLLTITDAGALTVTPTACQ